MSKHPVKLPESEARSLWRRAIEIQAAAERGERGPRRLPAAVADGFSVEEVIDAARGAGVEPQHIYLALAERALPDAELIRRDRWTARWARALLRGEDAIEISQLFDAPPERVAAAFAAIAATPEFKLELEDRVGPNPPYDGVLVYRVGRPSGWGEAAQFHGGMFAADARVLLVTATSEGAHTRLRLRLPVYEHGVNLSMTGVLTGVLGAAGGAGGTAAGTALAGAIGSTALPLTALPAAAGVLAGGALGVAAFRRVVRWGRRKGEFQLRRLLKAVALEVAPES